MLKLQGGIYELRRDSDGNSRGGDSQLLQVEAQGGIGGGRRLQEALGAVQVARGGAGP